MRFTRGKLLEAEVEALVNAVNTVGVMGKGIPDVDVLVFEPLEVARR